MLLFLQITLHNHITWSEWPVGKWLQKYQQFDLKGHVGVTVVKKVNHVKNMKTALISKLIMSSCRQQTKVLKSQKWPCHTIPPKGVKGQNGFYFENFQNATAPTD